MYGRRVEDVEAVAVGVKGADADLHRGRRVDHPGLGGVVEHGAVVDAVSVIGPAVAMGVEMNQGERAMDGGVGGQQRAGDEMVAAEADHRTAGGQDVGGVGLDPGGNLHRPAGVEHKIAVIDHRQALKHLDPGREMRRPGEIGRGPADRLRAKAGAWPVAGGEIEGDAGDGDIDVGEVAAIAPPHEAERAGIHRLGPAAARSRWR